MFNIAYCSDKYQYTMGKSFYDSGMKDQIAVFNLFYRKAPENNNWAVVSGTDEVIEMMGTWATWILSSLRNSSLEPSMLNTGNTFLP